MRWIIIGLVALVTVAAAFAVTDILSQPSHGTLTPIENGFRYQPDPGWRGLDDFIVRNGDVTKVSVFTGGYVSILGQFVDNETGLPMDTTGIILQIRSTPPLPNGRPYDLDITLGPEGTGVWVVPVNGTDPRDVVGYPPEIIQGHPSTQPSP